MADIGLEIRILREKKQMTSKELAEKVGLSQSQMSRLEKGQRRIDAKMLERISTALGVSPSYFFEKRGEKGNAATVEDIDLRHLTLDIGKIIRQRRRQLHLTPEELSDKIGRTAPYIRALEEGEIEYLSPETVAKLTKALKLSPFELFDAQQQIVSDLKRQVVRLKQAHTESTLGQVEASGTKRKPIPIFGSIASGYPTEFTLEGVPIGEIEDYAFVPKLEDENAFGLFCIGNEMEQQGSPSFKEGDILIFSPKAEVRNRDFVFARVRGERPLFRQIFYEAPAKVRLQPLNYNHPPLIVFSSEVVSNVRLIAHISRL
ncbi:MAG: XRE family transcriptional regulator [Planctomycetota bacterium]|nr:XRE family transcriptional regulator [Planctomycetota bacterium]